MPRIVFHRSRTDQLPAALALRAAALKYGAALVVWLSSGGGGAAQGEDELDVIQ